jgi:hypothetical protein
VGERGSLQYLGGDGRIILKLIFKKYDAYLNLNVLA